METDVTEILGFPTAPNYGTLNYSDSELEKTIKSFHEKKTQIAVHTHGEDAIDQVIKIYDKVCNMAGLGVTSIQMWVGGGGGEEGDRLNPH